MENKKYLKSIIGGITCSEEEKKECINQIKEAIEENKNGKLKELNIKTILKTYPESLDLSIEYYKYLRRCYKMKNKVYNKKDEEEIILLAHTPIIQGASLEEIEIYIKEFNTDLISINRMLVYAEELMTKKTRKKTNEKKEYDTKLAEKLADEIIEKKLNEEEILKKYKIKHYSELYDMIECLDWTRKKEVKRIFSTWQTNYNMDTTSWNRKYFSKLIGGIEASEEEKAQNIQLIKDAIIKNNNNEVTELKKEILLKSYPESINFLKDYYESLIHAHEHDSISKFKTYNHYSIKDRKTWREVLIKDRNAMLMIYAPYLTTLSVDQLLRYIKDFDMTLNQMVDILIEYKKYYSTEQQSRESQINDQKYDLNIIKQIINDVLVNGYKKVEIEKKYNLKSFAFDKYIEQIQVIDKEIYDQVKEKLKNNSEKFFFKMEQIIPLLYYYIVNGIEINNKKKTFTMLDYYCLTTESPLNLKKYLDSRKDKKQYRNRIIRFLEINKNVGQFESAETFAKKKIAFIINDKRVDFNVEKSSEIIEILKENKIPTSYKNVYIAAMRYASGEEILPIKRIIEQKYEEKGRSI